MRALFVFSGLLFYLSAFSQNAIRFAYDALGNRVKREIVLQNSDVVKRNMSSEEKKEDNFYSDMLSEKQIRIWPNPTEGHLKVEIQGLAPEEKACLRITSMSGCGRKRNNLLRFRTRPEPLHEWHLPAAYRGRWTRNHLENH